jgi:hypothetical protein
VHSLLIAAALMAPGIEVTNDVAVTRPDGSAVAFAPQVRVWCGRWEEDVPRRTLHVHIGSRRAPPFWQLSAVVADVRRRPVVRLPHSFVWNRPTGALMFATDGDNELSSAVEEASGRITFDRVRCGRRLAARFRVRAVLGSEFFDGEPVTVRGGFRARADL